MSSTIRVGNERCPQCAALGKDRHGDNLVRYDDGHAFCFSCLYREWPKVPVLRNLQRKIFGYQNAAGITTLEEYLGELTFKLPDNAAGWINKYELSETEIIRNQIQWSPEKSFLVLPMIDGHTQAICGASCRYFGPNKDHPKYINYYLANKPKDPYALAKEPPKGTELSALVLVEDMVSAIKVARKASCLPLLGTNISPDLFERLVGLSVFSSSPVLVWLDPDKHQLSIKHARRFQQFITAHAVISDKDPKYYNTDKIHDILLSTLSVPAAKQGELE